MKMNVYVFVYKNVSVSWGLYVLTQFQQMFILRKDAGQRPASLLKMSLFTGAFQTFC